MAYTYRIRDWSKHYENNRTRELKRMDWVPIPNRMDGNGYTELVDHPKAAAHFGAWIAIVEIASRRDVRGTLPQEGAGIPQALARMSRLPATLFEEVLPRLEAIGWIERIQQDTEIPQEGAGIPHPSATIPQEGAPRARAMKGREGNGREANGTGLPPDKFVSVDLWAKRFYDRHPKKKDVALVPAAIIRALDDVEDPQALLAEIDRVHALWCEYPTWLEKSGQFAPPLANWIEDRGWTQEPRAEVVPMHKLSVTERALLKVRGMEKNGTH